VPDAAPLPPGSLPDPAATTEQQQQQQQAGTGSSGLSTGAIAGIAAGCAVALLAGAAVLLGVRRHRRQQQRLEMQAKRAASGIDGVDFELGVAMASPAGGTLTTPRQRGSPPRAVLSVTAVSVLGTAAATDGGDDDDRTAGGSTQQLAGFSSRSSRQQLVGSGSRQRLAGNSNSAEQLPGGSFGSRQPLVGLGRPSSSDPGVHQQSSTTAGGAATAAGAAGAATGVQALDWAADLLAESSPQWRDAVVDEAEIEYLLGPDGRTISLGAGAYGHV